jgi:glycosyltransferase involved in cell wall biosynthesis
MTLNVCFLTGEYPPMQGGIADHTSHLAHRLVGLGVDVSVLTSSKAEAKHPDRLTEVDQSPRSFVRPEKTQISDLRVYPILTGWGLGCWRQIALWLDEHSPDVLHIQYQAAAFDLGGWINYLPWFLRWRGIPLRVVVTFHDLRVPYLFPKAEALRWRSILALASHSDAVITTNEEDKQTLCRALGIGRNGDREVGRSSDREVGLLGRLVPRPQIPDLLTLIRLGGNVEPLPPPNYKRDRWRDRLGIGDKTLLLAYFGFLNESKGGEDLVLALECLVRRGVDVHLLMVGGQVGDVDPTNRDYLERVRSLIQSCGMTDRVHWTGYASTEAVSANLLAADVVVMPYRDGVSFRRTTFIAALSHGRPVVTTCPAVPLVELQDGENVLLVPPGDVDTLAEAVTRLANDVGLRRRLSAGAKALGERFDWSTVSRQTLNLYRELGLD